MNEFLSSRSARAGLAILAVIGGLALFGPYIVAYPEASTRWRDISYWEDNPAGVPPAWVDGPWNGWALPSSTLMKTSPPLVRQGSAGRLMTWRFSGGKPSAIARDLVFRVPGGEGKVFLLVREASADAEGGGIGGNGADAAAAGAGGADPAAAGAGRELFRGEVDLVPGGTLRLGIPSVSTTGISATMYLAAGQADPGSPTILLVGKSAGLLGTDAAKRDVFTGLVLGIRWALLLGVVVSFLTVLSGLLLGTFAACYGGIFGSITNRVYEFFSMMPLLPFLVAVSAIHKPSLWTFAGLALLFFWTRTFKTVYSRALQIKAEGHIEAAVLVGAGPWWRVTRHVLPALLPYAFAMMAMSVPGIILAEAGVSLLGLGDATTVTWGQMLHDALVQGAVINGMWWWVLPPGLAIAVMGLSFALVGRGLDKVVNPTMSRR